MLKKEKELKEEIEALRSALEDTRRELEKRYADIDLIYRIVRRIHSALNMEELAAATRGILEEMLSLKTYSLTVLDGANGEYLFQVGKNLTSTELEGILQEVRDWAVRWSEDTENLQEAAPLQTKKAGTQPLACLPLKARQRLVGALATTAKSIEGLDKEEREVLSVVTTQIAVAIENTRLYEMTKRLAVTDELTGLYNVQYFQKRLSVELERARRYNRSLALLFIDIDHFKEYNDKFGVAQGDTALTEIGILLKGNSRESDIVARSGGEEFVLALPETEKEGAIVIAERLRKVIASHPFWGEKGRRNQFLTVSIGLACYPPGTGKPEELMKKAEEALKKDKGASRS